MASNIEKKKENSARFYSVAVAVAVAVAMAMVIVSSSSVVPKRWNRIILNLYAFLVVFFLAQNFSHHNEPFGFNSLSPNTTATFLWTANVITLHSLAPFMLTASFVTNFAAQTKWWVWILIYFTNDPKWQPHTCRSGTLNSRKQITEYVNFQWHRALGQTEIRSIKGACKWLFGVGEISTIKLNGLYSLCNRSTANDVYYLPRMRGIIWMDIKEHCRAVRNRNIVAHVCLASQTKCCKCTNIKRANVCVCVSLYLEYLAAFCLIQCPLFVASNKNSTFYCFARGQSYDWIWFAPHYFSILYAHV